MAKKEEKAKVGRPKLADNKTKKESLLVCLFVFVVIAIVAVLGFNILALNFNSKYLVGMVYNDHVNSCVVENNTVDCGPNVVQMRYKLDDKDYVEVLKEDKSIEVRIDNYNDVEVCYKTDKTDMVCDK